MKIGSVDYATIAACPSQRLDAAHYPAGGGCLCAGLVREERLAEIAELERRNTAMRRKIAENGDRIAGLRVGL